jgi:uncharacterized protein YkwD
VLRPIATPLTAAGTVLLALICSSPAAAADCDALGEVDAVVCEVNRVRAQRGLEPVVRDRRLHRAAAAHARDMAARGYFSHVTPEGERLSDRLRRAGYISGRVSWRVGETLAWGRGQMATPAATVAAWMHSPPHRRVVLGRYDEIGVGVADGVPSGGPGTTYAADLGALGG